MSHEYEHEHEPQAAPKQPSRPRPARGWGDTAQPALSPQEQQRQDATYRRQVHQLLREARGRAARAGASTDAAHTARDGRATPTGANHAAHVGDQAQDRDYLSQVQADLAAGNLAGALGLLDTYWPAAAHDRAMAPSRCSGWTGCRRGERHGAGDGPSTGTTETTASVSNSWSDLRRGSIADEETRPQAARGPWRAGGLSVRKA